MRLRLSFPLRVFLVALILRLIPVLLLADLGIGLDDMFHYDMLARSLATGNGYRWYAQEDLGLVLRYIPLDLSGVDYDPRGVPTAFRPPLYPAFLALIYVVAGIGARRFFIARLVQTATGAAVAPLTYALARRVFPAGERAARWAAWVVVVYPMLVVFPLALATENIFFPLVLLSLLALLKAIETRRLGHFAIAGAFFGLTALTRSIFLAVAGVLLLWLWFGLRERRAALLTFGALLLVVAPWVVRNSILIGRPAGIEVSLGYSLHTGYHPKGTGTFQYGISLELMPILDDGARDRLGMQLAWQFIRADPGRVPYLMLRKLGHFFGLERRAMSYFYSNDFFGYIPLPFLLLAAAILLLPFVIVTLSAAFGAALLDWRGDAVLLPLVFFAYLTPHVLIQAEERFHLMLVPLFAIVAAQFWTRGWRALKARCATPSGRRAVALACLAAALFLSNWALELWRDADKLALLLGPNGNQTHFPY